MSVTRNSLIASLATCGLLLAACGSDDDQVSDTNAATPEDASGDSAVPSDGDAPTIRAAFGVPAEEIKYVMIERPDLAPNQGECYEMEWTELAGNVNAVQALTAGTVDAATAGGLAGAQGIIAGGDMIMIGEFIEERSGYFSTAWVVKADSGIDTLADIEGKIVANSGVGSSTNLIEIYHLSNEAGLESGTDYEAVEIPFGQQQENLAAGRIDVGVFPQPFFDRLMASGDYKVLFRVTDVVDPFVQLTQAFSRDFVDEHPEAVKCFVDDFTTIAEWMADEANRDEVVAISSQISGLEESLLDPFLLTETDFYRPVGGKLNTEALQENWDFFYEVGAIPEQLTVAEHIEDDLLAGS